MAITNHDRVGKAMELLRAGLAPFVEREFKSVHRDRAPGEAARLLGDERIQSKKAMTDWDVAALLRVMWEGWNEIFRRTLGHAERSLVSELRDVRNRWAHQESFSGDDTDRALDTAERLLAAVSAGEAEEVRKIKMELRRVIFSDQARAERRRSTSTALESQVSTHLTPWREVVTPHRDVASGQYQQAEFAADLWQVHLGQGGDEYRDPKEFFRRTFLTHALEELLIGAVKRLQGTGGDPVVHLQTNFGGGKTHSMLALYHLCSETKPTDLLGIDRILHKAGADSLPRAKRVVLVGNKLSPGNPLTKPDGTVVRTLWGELAWQLGEQEAFERIRLDDERATNPGDALRELFDRYGPCLVLIDEWVAYARQLHDQPDLPGGTFDTQFTFAQSLTEAAKSATQALVVISLPASDSGHSPHASADDLEVGGDRGREALVRLRNVIGRLESSWKPATSEEGFEIVRRRLFEPILDPRHYVERDNVVRAFYEFYRTNPGEFPSECGKADYEKRLRDAYPIHPEVFDRLYNDWSTLVRFQRTRGVLRLMAAVIHHLWEQGDKSPMILPASIPIGDPRIQSELTRYLPDNWSAVIEKDVDGPNSLPRQIDEVQNLGRFSATRRVARTIYLGSAPIAAAANLGIEDRRIRLGCVMPGEQIAVFGDALRRLAANATYLYEDPPRYWYSTQPTVAKLAEDRAELLKREPDKIAKALEASLKRDLQKDGGFGRIHLMPATASDVGDELECGLVVFGPDHAHVKDGPSAAELKAKEILESRGNAPRLNRNTLVFLAPDKARYQDLEDALRRFLAWDSILTDAVELQLTPHQVKQALTQRESFESAVRARLPEGYQWALVPVQTDQAGPVTWEVKRVTGGDPLAVRVSKKLKNEELLFPSLGGVRLRMELDRVPLWRGGNHVALRQLVEDFARYVYLPRLMGPLVLAEAAASGVALLTWPSDGFAYAESYDEATGRYRGLRAGHQTAIGEADPGLLVRADAARVQIEAEAAVTPPGVGEPTPGSPTGPATETPSTEVGARLTRFHGTVVLDPERVGRDAGRVAEEVIAHLTGILGAQVEVVLEIEARIPQGVSDPTVRTVTENARTLRFRSHGFEGE